jgi:hypothetical protein
MDTLVGYVSFVFDSETIKLRITQQDQRNQFIYDNEEKVRLSNLMIPMSTPNWRSIANHQLIDELLYKKVKVVVEKKDPFEIIGKANVLEMEDQRS